MADKMYEEEDIRATAVKIRKLVPAWTKGITTKEMPSAVERVYEEGRKNGRNEGYSNGYGTGYIKGYDQGKKTSYESGYNDGYAEGLIKGEGSVELPELTNPGTAEDLVVGKQLIDGDGNVVDGALQKVPFPGLSKVGAALYGNGSIGKVIAISTTMDSRMVIDKGHIVNLSAPASDFGNATSDVVPKGYTFTSETGLNIDGAAEKRTEDDVIVDMADVTIPSGYYAEEIVKTIDTDPFYDNGYDDGWLDGYGEGYDDAVAEGGGGGNSEADEMMLLDEYHDWEGEPPFYSFNKYLNYWHSNISSSPIIFSAFNFHPSKYMHLYVYAETYSDGELYLTLVVPPDGEENSVEIPYSALDLRLYGIRWSDDGV